MAEQYIPERVDPFRYAEQSLGIEGIVQLANMHRLGASTLSKQGTGEVSLQFGIDEQDIVFLKGQVKATLDLQCQRCMGPFVFEIMSTFNLGIVNSLEEADALPKCYEPVLAKDGQLALRDLIEDEIILNLPIIPRHAIEQCSVKLPLADSGWEQDKGESPFRVLASLKHK